MSAFVALAKVAPKAIIALALFLVGGTLVHSGSVQVHPAILATFSSPAVCNPYAQPGYLHVSPAEPHANRWTTFGSGCPTPALMRAFMAHARPANATASAEAAERLLQIELGEDVEFAQNRTVVVFGDSIQRFSTSQFCDLAGGEFRPVSPRHPWLSGEDGDWRVPEDPTANKHFTHYCYVPAMDLLILQVFFFGLDEDEYWIARERDNPPYTFEDRADALARPILDAVGRTRGHGAVPDLVVFGSAMWDAARFMRDDLAAGADGRARLELERAAWFRRRTREALVHLADVVPGSPIRYMTNHYPLREAGGWFYDGKKPQQRLNRLEPLHQAALSAVLDHSDATADEAAVLRNVGINHWGELMLGTEDWQIDSMHPMALPGGYLWSDILLFELREAVARSRRLW
ncbi:hypothetical protein Q5752_007083 [Cryptotrichosporon argae]